MYNGGDSALTKGKHKLKIELRPYVKTPLLKVGDIIASGQLPMQVNRKPVINIGAVELSPLKSYKGLEISTDGIGRKKIKELKANIESDISQQG